MGKRRNLYLKTIPVEEAREKYFDCEIILMSDDHEETIFEVEEINDEY